MNIAICKLKSETPYSQGRYHQADKKNKESSADYEERTWREKCHVNKKGNIIMPPMSFANSIKQAAQYSSIKIPGEASAKFTKNFAAGVLVISPLILNIKKEDVIPEWVFVPSDGKRGGGKRVMKCFPLIEEWEGIVSYHIFDDKITKSVFEEVLKASGSFIGVGRFRPSNWGYYGRFKVEEIKWKEQ